MKKEIRSGINGAKDMTEGKPSVLIVSFAVPFFLSQLFQQLYNTADSFIVGNYLGEEALAAVSSSGVLIFLLIGFFNGLSMGAGVVISKYFGACKNEKVNRAIHTDLCLHFVCGAILTLIGVLFTPTLLRWMNTDERYMDEAVEYFRWYFYGSLTMVIYNAFKSIMNALGNAKDPLYYLIFSSLVNIGLDLMFIGWFGWGVWSAAFATVLSQLASCVLCAIHMSGKNQVFRICVKELRFDKDLTKEIIRVGLPTGVQNSVIGFANTIVQSQINTFGMSASTAFGLHSKIEGFAFLPITSYNMAITTFVSQNLGAGMHKRAKSGALYGIISSVILAEAVGLLYYLFAPQFLTFFGASADTIMIGTRQAQTVTLFYFLLAFSHAVASVCRGAGKAWVPMLVMLIVWCVIRVSYIMLVMHLFNDIGYVYWAYPITWAISSVIYLFYYLLSDWIHGFDGSGKNKKVKNI